MKMFLCLVFSLFLLWLKITSAAAPFGHQLLCIDKERHALLHFKANIQDRYGFLATWTHEQEETNDCCNWYGVTCNNQTGHVTSLNLHFGRLQGKISPSLLNLSYLNHLDLSLNEFHGTLPNSISSLPKLRYLDLSNNEFYGTLLNSISSLTNLNYLDLSVNSFNGSIPMFNGSMTQLWCLDLSQNSFHGTIPMFIGSMTQLRYLDLSYNYFIGTIPPEIGNITNLHVLSLANFGGCTIENLDWLSRPTHLVKLDMEGVSLVKGSHWVNVIQSLQMLSFLNLRGCDLSQVTHPYSSYVNSSPSSIFQLDLSYNNLNSSMYHWLFQLTSNRLVHLDLSGNKLDGIPRYLGNLCDLGYLDFSNNDVAFKFSDLLYNLSGCTSDSVNALYARDSQFTGSLSDNIKHFTSLVSLDLSNNMLNGTISEKVWELPKLQDLLVSSNSFKGAISENIEKSKLWLLDLSNNSFEGVPSVARMPNLSYISLRSCKLGPGFPKWIQTMKNLTSLDIANTGISDAMPVEFWNMWPSRLHDLDLSSNNITGKATDLLSNFDSGPANINLSSNNFYGSIKHVPSGLIKLDLSKNKFYGEIYFLCQIIDGSVFILDLSHNSFTGTIPDCLWHFKELIVLNLGQNNLSGKLPSSVEYLLSLEVLDLNNNNLSGELPLSLKKCTKLTFLELKGNTFSGYVPNWIGEKLSGLYALNLASNNFFGTIPLQLCYLVNLQILDLSMNNLIGTIPSCFNNLTAMVQGGFSQQKNVHDLFYDGISRYMSKYIDHEMIGWQGSVREFRSTLGMVKIIDLSSNNLTGNIPYELTDLRELVELNLSMNALQGEIPQNIGLLKSLLHLDLSRNNLSGQIPTSMSQMTLLNYLDVSCNNLTGRIPSSTQLQSFEPSRYTGNGLCGPPLTKYCPGDKELEMPIGKINEDGGEGIDEVERWFYIGGATGFATGFWIACGALLVNRRGGNAFFQLFEGMTDWVYVKVMVFVVKWQRGADA